MLTKITPDDLRAHCAKIVERGAPATAIHVRDILKQIYGFAILHGEKVANPADDVGPASIAGRQSFQCSHLTSACRRTVAASLYSD